MPKPVSRCHWPIAGSKKKKQERVDDKDEASSVSSESSSSSMSAGSRKQKKSQDKAPLAPSDAKAKNIGDDEASESFFIG